MIKVNKGFSLLETLIATGVLIIVTLGVVSLSNSLISGTVINADKTIINRWAQEGIELTQKIRDDNILGKVTDISGLPNWFEPAIADNGSDYGWYKLSQGTTNSTWKLDKIAANVNLLAPDQFKQNAETLTSDQTVGYRLICIEAFDASSTPTDSNDNQFHCNTQGSTILEDGLRTALTDCQTGSAGQPNDLYCQLTKTSVNKNHLASGKIVTPGNAVKIRAVVAWESKDQLRSSSITTVITNWKGFEQ